MEFKLKPHFSYREVGFCFTHTCEAHYSFKKFNNKQHTEVRWDAQRHKDMLWH